jgi:hypothetical protein
MNISQTIKELHSNTNSLLTLLENHSNEVLNLRKENQWSVLDCVEHLFALESLLKKVIAGTTEKTERDPEEKVELIKQVFRNHERKLNAPAPIAPGNQDKDKASLLLSFSQNRNELAQILDKEDVTRTCLDFSHHFFKQLTRYEWANFILYHSERHQDQVKNILNSNK